MLACYFHVKDHQFVVGIAMLRCYAVFLRSEPNSCTTTVKRRLRCIQVIRVQTLRVRSGGLWSAFAAKGFKANGNVPLPCLIFVQKKRQLKPRFQKLQWSFRLASSLKVLPQWGPWDFGANKYHHTQQPTPTNSRTLKSSETSGISPCQIPWHSPQRPGWQH